MALFAVRRAGACDQALLAAMLAEAVNWHPGRPRLAAADLAAQHPLWHYVEGWPRPDDVGFVAEAGDSGIGAAWARRFPWADPGYGFVDERFPEVTVGVAPAWRGHGVGSTLLRTLAEEARHRGVPALSLSVEAANPALRLYLRLGYEILDSAHGAHTLLLHLARS